MEGNGPELVGSSVWYSPNATLLNTNFDLAIVQMVCLVVVLFVQWLCHCFLWLGGGLVSSHAVFLIF